MTPGGSPSARLTPAVIGLVAALIAAVFAFSHIARNDMNPTIFIAVGQDDIEIREYAEAKLGEVTLRPELGHDGRFFFVQGNDPWILHPEENAIVLDRPVYRSQRMLYPLMAGLGGVLAPEGVVWGMILINVLAIGFGAWACAVLAARLGGSPIWGLAFPFNIGLISEFSIGGAGVVAAALAFAGVWMFYEQKLWEGILLLSLSALAREAMLVVCVGCFLWFWRERRRRSAILVVILPALLVGLWGIYARMAIPDDGTIAEGNLDVPFAGFVGNLPNWWSDPLELAVGLTVVAVIVFYTVRAIRRPSLVAWAFLPFAALAFLLAAPVWDGYFNITRAIAPILTAYFLVAFAETDRARQTAAIQNRSVPQ